jgi:NAD(P)-dependent dehydrogenase (short-subunit alcohol dehydrogenase family)
MSNDMNLQGKVAIVTGAAGGIGAACGHELARRGAAVLFVDINEDAAKQQAEQAVTNGCKAAGLGVDLSRREEVQAMVENAVRRFGRLDILHNNAAATAASVHDDDLVAADPEIWETTFDVNVLAPMIACKYAIPHMVAQGGGVIINTSSGSGVIGEPTRFAYGASKAAINSLTRSIAARYGKQGVRCVAVSPGITLGERSMQALAPTGWLAMMARHHTTPRLGTPEDIAKFVAFLASDDAGFISGTVHAIDGGCSTVAPFAADMRDNGYGIF